MNIETVAAATKSASEKLGLTASPCGFMPENSINIHNADRKLICSVTLWPERISVTYLTNGGYIRQMPAVLNISEIGEAINVAHRRFVKRAARAAKYI